MSWRKNIDKSIKDHLELQIRESAKHKKAYIRSSYPRQAQLWIAIANLSRQIFDLELRLKYLEGALREIAKKPITKTQTKKISKKRKR